MNPPFGTKNNEGVDVKLLSAAINVSEILFYLIKGFLWEGILTA
jgi:predicted RNA methylase